MTDHPVLSADALEAIKAELADLLENARPKMAARLKAAIELGDISDSSDFESAKQDQAILEGRIQRLESIVRDAVVRDSVEASDVVTPGQTITVRDTADPDFSDEFIVGESEERITGRNVVSPESPLGQALLGKRVGDKVTYDAPGGTFTYEIVSIDAR